ncbi:hypothetical protein BDV98DRAFT_385524 [Pterulicium gracile]|uniref:Uncharacterized protein n=1 Tax=Pterulicium gracile TaxID=1884261 RepID=A0A5C3QYL1_9AGAR|nr:hypothetical protein BDV98DRAFT_385524 [Pterula gracilis]
MPSKPESKRFYTITGSDADVQPLGKSNHYDKGFLEDFARAVAGPTSPIRPNGVPLQLALGITRDNNIDKTQLLILGFQLSTLLDSEHRTVHWTGRCSVNIDTMHSISPIEFSDEKLFLNVLRSRKFNPKKGKSSVTTLPDWTISAFEHNRLVYQLLTLPYLPLDIYGAPPIPKSSIAMISLVYSEWTRDERANEAKLTNPTFLDVAYTIIDLSGTRPVCGHTKRFRVKANAAMGQAEGYEINPLSKAGQGRPPAASSTVQTTLAELEEIGTDLNACFSSLLEAGKHVILLTHPGIYALVQRDIRQSVFRKLGVDTSRFDWTGMSELLGRPGEGHPEPRFGALAAFEGRKRSRSRSDSPPDRKRYRSDDRDHHFTNRAPAHDRAVKSPPSALRPSYNSRHRDPSYPIPKLPSPRIHIINVLSLYTKSTSDPLTHTTRGTLSLARTLGGISSDAFKKWQHADDGHGQGKWGEGWCAGVESRLVHVVTP